MTDPNGLEYVPGTYHAFGNDGSVSDVANSQTALAGLPNRTTVLNDLTITSDHLPIVADYTDTVTPPVGPNIGSLSVSPGSVTAGTPATLTANNVAEFGSGTITGVNFYRESNGISGLQVGSDTLLGPGTQNGSQWSLSTSTTGLGGGVYTYYALATDSSSATSNVLTTTLSINGPSAPTIGSFSASPTTAIPGTLVTLQASNVTQTGGTISNVTFYEESNGVPGLQIGSDTALGTGTQGGSSWFDSTDTTGLPAGPQVYYAVATNSRGVSSVTSSTTVTLSPPQVTGLEVDRDSWTPAFLAALQSAGEGNGLGYAIPVGSSAQLLDLPWTNVDQIQITFSQDVSVSQASLGLTGIAVPNYAFSSFNYDPTTFTAIWTLATPLAADKLHLDLAASGPAAVTSLAGSALDGEWTDAVSHYPSGNGTVGGDFKFSFNVLPADGNRDGIVNGQDIAAIASNWLQPSLAGDVNGDDLLNGQDIASIASNWLAALPTGGGGAGASVAPVVASVPSSLSFVRARGD